MTAVDPFDGGHEDVLSYLHGVAVANQPGDVETGPVMVPVAFAARVSDKDNQDPTLSIPRQLARCREALPPYCVIVAFFWDVESGRTNLELRGHSDAHEMFNVPVPRDGGVTDLLEEARHPNRRFVAVVCESVDRLARVTYFGTKIEYELEQSGVALLAADEGITADALPSASGVMARKRATPILTRRVKQAIAEWYVLDMLEKAWGGLMEHTEQGFNIGKPPYGYQVVVEKHPVPAKAALGKVKRRLVRDPLRGPVVTRIYTWRVSEQLSYDEIADRLNLDPDQYPPPEPILGRGRRAIGAWTKGSVRDVLCNPVPAHHAGKDWFATHPKSLWVREDKLLELVRSFFSRRIFGPEREALLVASQADEPVVEDGTAARAAALRSKIRDLERQQANVVKELREYRPTDDEDIDQQWRGQLRDSFAEIAAQRKSLEAQLSGLTTRPEAPTLGDPRLLDRLPIIEADLGRLPEDVERELFDGFQLQVRYHQPTRRVTLRVTIDGEAIPRLTATSRTIMGPTDAHATPTNTERPPTAKAVGGPRIFSLAVSAPGRTRTYASSGHVTIVERIELDQAGQRAGTRREAVDVDQTVLRHVSAQLGFGPDDGDRVKDLAAVAVTRMAWRDSPVEDWHSVRFRRIGDGEMMRANAAATRLVRSILIDHPHAHGDLFGQVSQVLTDPDRLLPDGRRLIDLAPSEKELSRYQTHVEACCTGWADTVARNGVGDVLTLLACRGSIFNWRWWLATGWPQVVETFIQRIDDPALWQNAWEIENRRRIGDPPDGLSSTDLGRLLLAGPDRLSAAAATYCLRTGLSALLPQDCGLPPVRRHLLPPDYLRLVEQPAIDPMLIVN